MTQGTNDYNDSTTDLYIDTINFKGIVYQLILYIDPIIFKRIFIIALKSNISCFELYCGNALLSALCSQSLVIQPVEFL